MSDELPDEVRSLIERERARPEPPADELARLRSAVDLRLASTGAPARPRMTISTRSLLLGVAVGAVVAHLADRVLRPPRVQVEVRWLRPPSEPVPVDAGGGGVVDAARHVSDASARGVVTSDASPRPASHAPFVGPGAPREYAAERLLIERCSSALVRGDAAGALVAAREHERRFRDGILVEEREALTIQALRALGRETEAATRTEAFFRRWPASMHAGALRGVDR